MPPFSHHNRLEMPTALRLQLDDFRSYVGRVKLLEAVAGAMTVVLSLWLVVFVSDRLWDTTVMLRTALLGVAVTSVAVVPLAIYRWIWRQKRAVNVAYLLSRRMPHLGDQLLGILELLQNPTEQARSPSLCVAAIEQVTIDASRQDLRAAAPKSRHLLWNAIALLTLALGVGLLALFPTAAVNAATRFFLPWQMTPRYTFAALESLPENLHVAYGEPFSVTVKLTNQTRWLPKRGEAVMHRGESIFSPLVDSPQGDRQYQFEFPGQTKAGRIDFHIGDAFWKMQIEPIMRPELTEVLAQVRLPAYLGLPERLQKDVRGGALSLVQGSRATIVATASRQLAAAQVNGTQQQTKGATITSQEWLVETVEKGNRANSTEAENAQTLEFQWQDRYQLEGQKPFSLTITSILDQPPTLACENLPRRRVVLNSEQLVFQIKAHDDFGVKQLGMEWQGLDPSQGSTHVTGERILAAGGHDQATLDATGTFSAEALGIETQLIGLRVFVEDYLPERPRVYTSTYLLKVLDAHQHAIWMTEQLSQWHRRALEVRDRELQLYDTNRQLRELPRQQLEQADTRRRIENQASAERANGYRLAQLSRGGVELIRQAARNPEFGVGHLEKWAEMLNLLQEISAQRMPSVANLLKEASQAKNAAAKKTTMGPSAGVNRATAAGSRPPADSPPATAAIPQISDVESTQRLARQDDQKPPSAKGGGGGSLSLPTTTLLGGGSSNKSCPVEEKVTEAVREQRDLLTEFEKIANELNHLLANLEGSTLVKRLKAASRAQDKIAVKIGGELAGAFGMPVGKIDKSHQQVLQELALLETEGSQMVSQIMDDMQGYFERRRLVQFKTVLDDMRMQDVVAGLRQLGDEIPTEQGLSLSQCEFWSDSLDRWAEDLVDPAAGGT